MGLAIFLTIFLPYAAAAGCLSPEPPHTLDNANGRVISQLQAALKSAQKVEPVCDQDLAKKEERVRSWLSYFRQTREVSSATETAWLRRLLARKVSVNSDTAEACAFDRELKEAEEFYARHERRAEEINDKMDSVASAILLLQAEKEILRSPQNARKLIGCREDLMLGNGDEDAESEEDTRQRDRCLSRTKATAELWEAIKFLEANPDGLAAGLSCLLTPETPAAVKKNINLAKEMEKGAKNLMESSFRYIDELKKNAPARLAQIKQRRKDLRAWKCDEWQKAEDRKIESSVRKLVGYEDSYGSGFVLHGRGGKPELLTARHVAFGEEGLEPENLRIIGLKAEKQPRHGIQFQPTPGLYDRGRDLVKRSLASAPSAFTAVADETVIPAGEKVRISGYPANREGEFTSLTCEVIGIGRNVFSTPSAESYILRCPGAESHIGGASGGPVTDGRGEVIGSIVAHNPLTNMVVVQPVSRGADGENRFGFQKAFHYQNCLDDTDASDPKPCQVIPGLTYEKSVP